VDWNVSQAFSPPISSFFPHPFCGKERRDQSGNHTLILAGLERERTQFPASTFTTCG